MKYTVLRLKANGRTYHPALFFSPPPPRGKKRGVGGCYIELTLKQAKINFAQIREVCKIDSENQQTFCK